MYTGYKCLDLEYIFLGSVPVLVFANEYESLSERLVILQQRIRTTPGPSAIILVGVLQHAAKVGTRFYMPEYTVYGLKFYL